MKHTFSHANKAIISVEWTPVTRSLPRNLSTRPTESYALSSAVQKRAPMSIIESPMDGMLNPPNVTEPLEDPHLTKLATLQKKSIDQEWESSLKNILNRDLNQRSLQNSESTLEQILADSEDILEVDQHFEDRGINLISEIADSIEEDLQNQVPYMDDSSYGPPLIEPSELEPICELIQDFLYVKNADQPIGGYSMD